MPKAGSKDVRLFPRNEAIYAAYVNGATQDELAKEHKLTQARISIIIGETIERLRETFHERIADIKVEQTMQLRHVYSLASEGYERSIQNAETIKVTTGGDRESAGASGKAEKTTKGQAGDAAFLREMRGAAADIRKIWGLDAPVKTEGRYEHSHTGQIQVVEQVVTKREQLTAAFNAGNGSNGSNGHT